MKKKIVFSRDKKYSEAKYYPLERVIDSLTGVEVDSREGATMILSYNPYLISDTLLVEKMGKAGFVPRQEIRKKGFLQRWIDNLARSNRKSFGNQPLDCCGPVEK